MHAPGRMAGRPVLPSCHPAIWWIAGGACIGLVFSDFDLGRTEHQ
jgi:hypothetical protein